MIVGSVFALIPAAGSGVRFGADRPKVAIDLVGLPIASHSIRTVDGTPGLLGGAVIAAADQRAEAMRWIAEAGVDGDRWQVVDGGKSRHESVSNGFAVVPESAEWVLVHDAARPCLHPQDRDATLARARECGAAILAHRIVDTVKRVDSDGLILETIDRAELRGAETPQIARRDRLAAAIADAPVAGVTDEAGWLEAAGLPVAVVEARYPNPKVTLPDDLEVARALLGS
ncbi:MAG: 2-C-methyl-D-erythritol 4-phosphate cytidylyltransferase [Planctomycetota bacterium]